MYSKTIFVAAIAAFFASQAIAAAVPEMDTRAAHSLERRIAPNAAAACNCPDNCKHKNGSSCKFYSNGNTLSGECNVVNGGLTCVA